MNSCESAGVFLFMPTFSEHCSPVDDDKLAKLDCNSGGEVGRACQRLPDLPIALSEDGGSLSLFVATPD